MHQKKLKEKKKEVVEHTQGKISKIFAELQFSQSSIPTKKHLHKIIGVKTATFFKENI